MDAGQVRGLDRAEGGGGPPFEEVPDQLARGLVGAPAEGEGLLLEPALQGHARERVAGVVLVGGDADDDRAVGVALVARVLAHAVGHDPAGLGGGGDDRAAGAHAEAVDRAAVAAVVHQLVVGGAEDLVPGLGAPAGLVDHALGVLDAKADREGLGLDVDAAVMDHLEGVAGAVPDGEDDVVRLDELAVRQAHALDPAVLDRQVVDAGLEADLAAEREDRRAHGLDDRDQAEGADVGPVDVEDLGRGAGLDELLEHLAPVVVRIAHLAVELAV